MKRKLLIWSFGNADIYYQNQLLEYSDDPDFEWLDYFWRTEKILEQFEKYQDKISFKMLDEFVEQQEKELVYDFIVIYTKQNSLYHRNDTHLLYPLLKKYREYKSFQNVEFALYDENYQIVLNDAFDQERIFNILVMDLEKIKKEIDLIWFDEVIVNITWGTKIMALLLTSVVKNLFKFDHIHLYYGLRDKKRNITNFISIDNFLKDF